MLFAAIFTTACCLPMIIFKNKPEHYPSPAAKLMGTHKFDLKGDGLKMLRNKNFLLFTVVFSFMFAIYTCLGATINYLTEPYSYSVSDIALAGGGFIVAGIVGSFLIGIILDKYPKYLLILRILVGACCLVCIPYVWTLPSGKLVWFMLNNIAFGFFALPLIPVGAMFCVEISFPVSEAISLGWIISWSQVLSFGFTYLAVYLS